MVTDVQKALAVSLAHPTSLLKHLSPFLWVVAGHLFSDHTQAYLAYCASQTLSILQIEGKTFLWQDYGLLYCNKYKHTFIAVVQNQAGNISELCLQSD